MKTKLFIIVITTVFFFVSFPLLSADKKSFENSPALNGEKKWRVSYYEGGEYLNYQQVLTATIKGLMELGWIEPKDIPQQRGEQTKDLWLWFSDNLKSDYIEFIKDAHYTSNWDDHEREKIVAELTDRLNNKRDIDLLIAMGTWAGKDFANDKHSTPMIVLSTSDPIAAGIIKSTYDSGFPHVHAHVDPDRWERQIRLFHEIIGFKKMGVAYEDTIDGRSYAAIDVINKVSKERSFEVISCHTKSDIADMNIAEKSVKQCFKLLVEKVDAIYVTEQGGVSKNTIPELVAVTNKHQIATFAQYGSEMVKYGFLVSTSTAGFRYVGQFHALTMAKIFNGAKPNQLDQVYQEPPRIAINLKTAELIGYDPALIILGAADEIYRDIEMPK